MPVLLTVLLSLRLKESRNPHITLLYIHCERFPLHITSMCPVHSQSLTPHVGQASPPYLLFVKTSCKSVPSVSDPAGLAAWLNEGKEAFLEDVKDCGEEEGQSQEDEQLVRQLPPVVLKNQLPPQVDGSSHVFKLLVGFLHCPG